MLALTLVGASPKPLAAQGRASSAPPVSSAAPLRVGRIVGVYDVTTGSAIEGVDVVDMDTRLHVLTTSTGTLSLFFVDTSGGLLQFRKLGYMPQVLFIANSLRDTVPLTVLLTPVAQALPGVLTTAHGARGPADTVRRLELQGFYERQHSTGAPSNAFVTAEQLTKISLLANLKTLTGRTVCEGNLYVDGTRVSVPSLGRGRRTRDGLDALLNKDEIVGIELYRASDAPAEYNATSSSSCGVTLIWTRR